jgi:RNA polymerase sigma-70 factor (ECF subfamily)
MNEEQDAVDVNRVLAGELDAFSGIVRRWQGLLVTLAFRYCRDRDKAEDMAQAAFLKAFQALPQWRGDGRFGSWLYTVATNVYRSEMRRRRWHFVPLDAAAGLTQPGAGDSNDTIVDRKSVVRHMVSALPAKYRDTILLFYFHRMDVQETARSLGVADGTVKARLHRGRALLKRKLRHHLGELDWRSDND